jgi:hypothetical protein
MKKTINILLLAAVFTAFAANAKEKEKIIELEDASAILGKWDLYAETAALHKEKKEVKIQWDFKKNGILETSAEDTRGRTRKMSINVTYSIENGVIKKQIQPGRQKFEYCKVIKLEGKDMTLHCKYLYFLLRKK